MICIISLDNSKHIKLISFVSCVAIFFVFVFGCIQFAFASDSSDIEKAVSSSPGQYYILALSDHVNGSKNVISSKCLEFSFDNMPSRICAVLKADGTMNSGCSIYADVKYIGSYSYRGLWDKDGGSPNDTTEGYYLSGGSSAICNVKEYKTNVILFGNDDDAKNYMLTGEINNPLYQPKVNYEYDSSIEIPLMAQCQVNGNDYLFNCKQSVPHDDYKLQVAVDLRLTPIYGNFASKQYSDKNQIFRSGKIELGSYDNKGTVFNTSFSTDDLLNGIDTNRKSLGFKEFYQGYNILLPYKEPVVSEVIFYARNVSGNKCSNWVRVTFDLITETSKYEEVESVSGSNIPSDTKTSNSEYYPEDYVYNDNDAYGGDFNVSGTLNSLEHNYTQLVNFYKDLFSFLPAEIWVILIGLVSTMVIIAIIRFVRG